MTAIPPELAASLKAASRVAVLTGAGISAESGVPTFRDAQNGLWAQFRPEELASPQAFARNPKLVSEWYAWRRKLVDDAKPNPGHYALARLESLVPEFTLITQNVDGLHRRAGSRAVIELHGNIHRTLCSAEGIDVEAPEVGADGLARCPRCGGLLRPGVVWFGEMLPPEALDNAELAARKCQVFLSIGTSTVVEPAASLPFHALQRGATVVEINPTSTPLSDAAHFVLRGPAGVILPALVSALETV